MFSGSRHTAITVTSAISLLMGSSLGALAGGDPARFGALAACTALIVGAIGLLARIVRAGAATNFFSESVMLGFKAGIGLVLASTQLPKLCGFAGADGGSFWERAAHFLRHLPETNPASLALGLGAVALLLVGKRLVPHQPVALLVVAGGIVLARVFNLGALSVHLLGGVPTGLPTPALPRSSRATSTSCCRSRSPASCSEPSRASRSGVPSPRSTVTAWTRTRSSSRSAPPTSPPASAGASP